MIDNMQKNNLFEDVTMRLAEGQIPSPRLEARLLIANALGIDAKELNPFAVKLDDAQTEKLMQSVQDRLKHKPICKIVGKKAFYKYDFHVDCNVLSPRPDTEILVEAAIHLGQKNKLNRVLDLGTGSGCILLSVIAELPNAKGVGVDISDKALAVAQTNAEMLGLVSRVEFVRGSWFDDDLGWNNKFDLIVSNPPYIKSEDINKLEPEVKDYDPMLALDGGADGYRDYKKLAERIPSWLKDGGYVLLEVGINQAEDVAQIFQEKGLSLCEIAKDLSGINRCVILKK